MMKIRICSGQHRIVIPVPYFMINNPVSALVIRKALQEEESQIDPDAVVMLMKEFSRMAKQYKGFELVRVESAEGDLVQVVL